MTAKLPISFALLFTVLAGVGAAALTERPTLAFVVLQAVFFATLSVGYILLMAAAERVGRQGLQSQTPQLHFDQAKQLTDALLHDPARLKFRRAAAPLDPHWELGPILRGFLDRYEHVEEPGGWLELGRTFLGRPAPRKDFLKIGEGFDGLELCVLPRDDRIFLLNPNSEPAEEPESEPTIYHLIANSLSDETKL